MLHYCRLGFWVVGSDDDIALFIYIDIDAGDAIVLSPGCASFDEFKNFEHRGLVFQELALSS